MAKLIYRDGTEREVKNIDVRFSPEQYALFANAVLALSQEDITNFEKNIAAVSNLLDVDTKVLRNLASSIVNLHDPADKTWNIERHYVLTI